MEANSAPDPAPYSTSTPVGRVSLELVRTLGKPWTSSAAATSPARPVTPVALTTSTCTSAGLTVRGLCVADGVVPGNEGRAYVLRRVVRRAVQHGQRIGLESPFLGRLADVVIEQMREAYPEVDAARTTIHDVLGAEEERFAKTLSRGLRLFDELAAAGNIAGDDAFRLHDTYGFPLELTVELAEERGLAVDVDGFRGLMEEQRERFLARLDEPEKNWKFEARDVEERGHWEQYMEAYQDAIARTAAPHAPWYVIPADKKWYMRTAVAEIIVAGLESLDLHYPKVDERKEQDLAAARAALEKEEG